MATRALLRAAAAAAVAAAATLVAAARASAPNVVVLVGDDWGWGDAAPPLGAVAELETPNLLAMLSSPNTLHLPRFYSGGPVCSPTRATILTGRTNTRDCVTNVEQTALPLQLAGATLADYAASAGAATAFFGKWHLSSLSSSLTADVCYPASASNGTCLPGYNAPPGNSSLCCDGRDAALPTHTPLSFGFETVMATSQVAPSSTSNCGCIKTVQPELQQGRGCNLGHYAGAGHQPPWVPGLECDGSFWNARVPSAPLQPYPVITAVDDAAMLVEEFEAFAQAAVDADKPFVAQISFHNVHIPFVAPPEYRALYAAQDAVKQDYWGAISAMDAAIGRVRGFLAGLGVAQNTLLLVTADNGPEVDSAHGHETAEFYNPGSTGGLRGRKRALTEGGIRVFGLLEAPFLVNGSGPLTLPSYVGTTSDILPTLLDLYGLEPANGWPLDGVSLVPALRGQAAVRPAPLGHLSVFSLESGNATCPAGGPALPPGAPASLTLPANQSQVSWAEGRDMKLFGCRNAAGNWRFSLFNITADASEAVDLLPSNEALAGEMFGRLASWLASVEASRQTETLCASQPRSAATAA